MRRAVFVSMLMRDAALVFVTLVATTAAGQLSPGALSSAHRSLSGPTQCTSCHKIGAGKIALRCLECHTEIAKRLNSGHGLHALQVNKSNPGQDCVRCHSEHKGADAALVRWEPSQQKFDHGKTGYALDGKHHEVACRKCHSAEHIMPSGRPAIRMKDLNRSFLGLPTDCLSCHKDIHVAQLGKDCRRCHTPSGWKTDLRFNHANAKFQLKGAHAKVECAKCHQKPADPNTPVKFVGLAFQRCADCHRDLHRAAFNKPCESCHNVFGWKQQVSLAGNFDHSKAKYVLTGKHTQVNCLKCHAEANFKKPVAHEHCLDCHKDQHNGQFARRADSGDCAGCHTLDGFKKARFAVADHSRTGYPLLGKHASVACAKCHLPAGKDTLYRVKYGACMDCHKDVHQGQFAAAPYAMRCDACHSVKGFESTSYTLAKHQKTRFPLVGSHMAVPCTECHKSEGEAELKVVRFRFNNEKCDGCHSDPHHGQFADRMKKRVSGGGVAGCEACHSTKSWKDLVRFDHSGTEFQLLGAHRSVSCIECHRPANLGMKLKDAVFKSAPKVCEDCHEDAHGGQFSAAGKRPACADCHNTLKFRPSLFDHERKAAFPLKGAHKDVRCGDCHKNKKMIEGKAVLFYKATPQKCIECHGANVALASAK